ncbi:glycosyltransferase involved in cell wall biosynthesis [Neobacillus niacini]|uniref:glycosyltransferase n=1 Tax=Neobacillus niacini TaxID=86668 RepID=UPI0027829A78|nr:glycosyltransferase [Neobacillus niacini]MDQ1000337.1 glycosyltransferase involved in cell wall biosynthesis [Neobacillus niacini]
MLPAVSIIVPIHNAEKYIHRCIDTIIEQTLENIEIILVNDGSPDNCGNIAEKYAKIDKRIKVIHQENSGPGMARNAGINAARGDYIGFVDPDDWIESNMYEELYNFANKYFAEICMSGYNCILPTNIKEIINSPLPNGTYNKESAIEVLFQMIGQKYSKINKPTVMGSVCWSIYKRNFIIENGIFFKKERRDFAEDLIFNIESLYYCKKLSVVDSPLYNYRINNNSLVKKYRKNKWDTLLALHEEIYHLLHNKGLISKCREQLNTNILSYALESIVNECRSENTNTFIEKLQTIKRITENDRLQNALHSFPLNMLPVKERVIYWFVKQQFNAILACYYTMRFTTI